MILILVLGCVSGFFCVYPNQTYIFASPVSLRKVVTRVLVVFLYLSSPIDWLCSRKLPQVLLVCSFIDQLIGLNLLLVHPVGVDPRKIEARCSNLLITLEDNFELVPPV